MFKKNLLLWGSKFRAESGILMKRPPRSLEEWLYLQLLDSPRFHRFVGNVYRKVNGIKDGPQEGSFTASEYLFQPTKRQKFKAYRILFWDEMRSLIGLPRKSDKFFNRK
ncbi:hypothetical protein ZYGR_0I04430 [Zygosaccharomyces rouxii]|nr:hypothetical protein ZYGR_0I04430 [Zygosaccharomyces rouxii]